MSTIFQRYLGFMNSLLSSKKQCLSSLARVMLNDEGSLSSQNILTIARKADLENILTLSPKVVADAVVYSKVPLDEVWRIDLLKELLAIKRDIFELDFGELPPFSKSEIDDLIEFVATS